MKAVGTVYEDLGQVIQAFVLLCFKGTMGNVKPRLMVSKAGS